MATRWWQQKWPPRFPNQCVAMNHVWFSHSTLCFMCLFSLKAQTNQAGTVCEWICVWWIHEWITQPEDTSANRTTVYMTPCPCLHVLQAATRAARFIKQRYSDYMCKHTSGILHKPDLTDRRAHIQTHLQEHLQKVVTYRWRVDQKEHFKDQNDQLALLLVLLLVISQSLSGPGASGPDPALLLRAVNNRPLPHVLFAPLVLPGSHHTSKSSVYPPPVIQDCWLVTSS